MGLTIAPATLAELETMLGWAAAEGWNPGFDDAEAFHAVDPEGFLLGRLEGEPVAAVSVVRHAPDHAFLGLYLCRPEFRGQGHGIALWQAGMARMPAGTVGLDGVVAQQQNYRRSGFVLSHRTLRFGGAVATGTVAGQPITPGMIEALIDLDARCAGVRRAAYCRAWAADTTTRRTRVVVEDGAVVAAATLRACRGPHKLGPVYARSAGEAAGLIAALAADLRAEAVTLDVPEPNTQAVALADALGLSPVFETARMYRGPAPKRDLERVFGEITLELG